MTDIELFNGPDGAANRRLWFLQVLIDKMDAERALALATRLETFVATGRTLTIVDDATELQSTTDRAVTTPAPAMAPNIPNGATARPIEAVMVAPPHAQQRLLSDAQLQEFAASAAAGAGNRDLGIRFGLTPRQANGIRMALAKRAPQVALKRAVRAKPKETLDRATELQMQVDFMQRKPAAAPTVDDVVRFLRQRGDVVTRAGEGFTVNHRLTLTIQDLVRRANEKKTQMGQPPFPSDVWSVTPRHIVTEAADPNSCNRPLVSAESV
jgi:hypothetical protein